MGEMRNAYKIWLKSLKGKDHSEEWESIELLEIYTENL
jgi:hypothetical protein